VKYEQGVGSSLEVTAAETSLKESQNNYINALYESLINKVNLDRALGRINY
jgi:outer membrane protein TolC